MKKTLAAVAVLGAFAGSALAADVTVYGRLDTGVYLNDWEKTTAAGAVTEGTDWEMKSGNATTSRIGIKGSEKISDDLTVGFVLEKKLLSDSGQEAAAGFDRESVVFVKTNYGTVYAGRINSMWSDGGSTNFWAGKYSAFGTGSSVGDGVGMMVGHSRADNRVSYVSPKMGGFTVQAEYSFGADKVENKTTANRPAALGVNYQAGNFGLGAVVTHVNEAHDAGTVDQEDEMTVNVGTSYDFGVAKVMLAAQYFQNADKVGNLADVGAKDGDEFKGYGVTLGATVPMAGGKWIVGGSYTEGEDDAKDANNEFKGYNVAAQYEYPLSKQFKLYGGVGYTKMESDTTEAKVEATEAMAGMVVYF